MVDDQLLSVFPYGAVASRKWLLDSKVKEYVILYNQQRGNFVSLQAGIYRWNSFPVKWQAVIASLSRITEVSIWVGGKSALAMQGMGHYINNDTNLDLYSRENVDRRVKRFFESIDIINEKWYSTATLWNNDMPSELGLKQWKDPAWDEGLLISTPERAVFELLHILPKHISFSHADVLFQGLTTLSPRRLKELLSYCKSVKVKRLFFWFADRYNYPWLKHLNADDYNFGSGKRSIAEGGMLDKKYLITVPRELVEGTFNG